MNTRQGIINRISDIAESLKLYSSIKSEISKRDSKDALLTQIINKENKLVEELEYRMDHLSKLYRSLDDNDMVVSPLFPIADEY